MKQNILLLTTIIGTSLFVTSCKKTTSSSTDVSSLKTEILQNISTDVCTKSYTDLETSANVLETSITALKSNPTQSNLETCKANWLAVRNTWEKTESWLFGPISANNIDPRIDSWPVDFNAIDSVLNANTTFTDSYIDNLEDALKGFHPIEYFLWGANGNKLATDFTSKQLDFLVALSHNLSKLSKEVNDTWKNGFKTDLANAGNGSTVYASQKIAYTEIVDAMAGICDEVANGKIDGPFIAQDPTLEESPYSNNSLTDFKNNIQGVMMMYQASYSEDKKGIEDLVREYNLSLDQEIKTAHAEAMASLNAISMPFGQAIIQQPILVQNAINKINALEEVLDNKLKPFLLQYTQ